MDHVICRDEVEHGKPEPDLFLAAFHKWEGINPVNAIMFEDSPLGIAAANRAGIPTVFVPDPHVDPVESLRESDAKPILALASSNWTASVEKALDCDAVLIMPTNGRDGPV
jgi:pseudouridine-5'-monophosphatase